MTNQSLFLIAAVTVLLIMLLGLANASTTSEGFETYTNEDYGFSIEYPSNFQELESNLQEYQVVKFLANYDVPAAALSIFIGKINPNMSLYEAANLTNDVSIRQISMTNTPVSGMPAVERVYYQYENDATAKIKGVYILNNDNLDLIKIRYITEPQYFDEYITALDHMLQSFKIGVS